jgi:hypothetical protein
MKREPSRKDDDTHREVAAVIEEEPLLGQLARAWQKAHPEKAAGGPRALGGFHFQLEIALLKHIQGWLQLSPSERDSQQTFVEEVSDVVTKAADQPLVVRQVKLSQDPQKIRKGLDDLLTVHTVAQEVAPGRANEIQYVLVFRSADPERAQGVIDAWAEMDPALRRPFADRVRVGAHPDPGGEIETLLSHQLRADEPQRLRHEWVGDLLHAVASPAAEERRAMIEATTRLIWRRLTDLDRSRKPPGGIYLVSPCDVPPDQPERGDVLTGQQPSFHYLRQGFFADRPRVVERIRERFERWVESRSGSSREAMIQLFWIAGRSGSGKSILLVQLVSKLRQEGWDPIFWLGNKARLLPDAVRWSSSSFSTEGPPLIGVDDPYGPGGPHNEAWEEFLAELNSVRQGDDLSGIPIVVCCGPTEQAERLRDRFRGEIDLELFELPQEPLEELEELRDWYRGRTGAEAPEAEPNVLLVQLFFQWQVGQTMEAFAKRFRSRISDADESDLVLPLLEQALALNRLYLGFPDAAVHRRLPRGETDRLAQLLKENHLSVGGEGDRQGLWLAHPHLANGIYDAWFPPDKAPGARRQHFEVAAREFMIAGRSVAERLAPVEAIALGISADDSDIRSRIDPGLIEALPNLYSGEEAPSPEELPLGDLALWIEVQTATGVTLTPDPVDIALPLLTRQATSLRETAWLCEAMLRATDRLDDRQGLDLFEIVIDLLEEVSEWSDWGRIARVALDVSPSERLTRLGASWIDDHLRLEGAGWVLEGLLTGPGESADIVRPAAMRLLSESPRHQGWGRVWTALWDLGADPNLQRLAFSHLRAFPQDLSWAYIWQRLASDPSVESDPKIRQAIHRLGRDWLTGITQHLGWGVVWSTLWTRDPSDDLERQGRRWLRQTDPSQPAFGYVWTALWSLGRRDGPLREEGINALRRLGTSNRNWGQVYPVLYEAFPNPDLRALGLRWLGTARPDDPPWGYVLPALWNVASEHRDSELLAEIEPHALRFLDDARPGHGGWRHIFGLLWTRRRSDGLRDCALRWLSEAPPVHSGIAYIWELLWEDERNSESLVKWASAWLPGQFDHQGWAYVWRRICLETDAEENHFKLGEEWLLATPTDNEGWTYVFLALRPMRQGAGVRAKAFLWLSEKESHMAWDMIWRELWVGAAAFGDRDELQARGLRWIRSHQKHKQWPDVWTCLWAYQESDELRRFGEEWLAGAGRGHNPKKSLVTFGLKGAIKNPSSPEIPWREATEILERQIRAGVTDRLPEALAVAQALPVSSEERDQDAWRKLWSEVWARTQTYRLRETAIEWLEVANAENRHGDGYMWNSLWSSGRTRKLYEIGTAYLAGDIHGRSSWPSRWIKLWQFEPSATLRDMGTVWLEQNGGHRLARNVERCLSEDPPLLDGTGR